MSAIAYLRLMRPKQWIKNLAVLAGPAFAQTFDNASLAATGLVFASFCLVSSASYTLNDLFDRHADALHPVKKHRPIACGDVSSFGALVWAILLLSGGLTIGWYGLPHSTVVIVTAYFVLVLSYSMALKRRMILDVIIIAIGFVLRTTAGADAVSAFVSPWLVVCTFTLCMFMGFGKRRCEIAQFETLEEAGEHRKTLLRYTPELLNNLISVSAGITIITFVIYTMDRDTPSTFPKEHLIFTLPVVVYGIFRYAMLVQSGLLEGPMEIVLRDRAFQATVVVWSILAMAIMTESRWVNMDVLDRFLGRYPTTAIHPEDNGEFHE
jgi:decaprenyl-phosphate phosphoribosyltransferase